MQAYNDIFPLVEKLERLSIVYGNAKDGEPLEAYAKAEAARLRDAIERRLKEIDRKDSLDSRPNTEHLY